MNRNIATHRFFTQQTQRAFYERVDGYISQEEGFVDRYERIRQQSGVGDLVRLDLGQNRRGCAPEVREFWRALRSTEAPWNYLSAYPEIQGMELQGAIAGLHGVRPEWIQFSAGLEQMISMIAATFLENRDRFLVTDPGFFLFDEDSRRNGGIPLVLPLDEEGDFAWNERTLAEYEKVLQRLQPKLIWIANPNNPTGRHMDPTWVERLVALAEENLALIVIDEAYGEYADPDHGVLSASALVGSYRNLIVLRSFSKAYGLAGIRVGYAMTSNREVATALRMHRTNYPISRTSFELAREALRHQQYLADVRREVAEQRAFLLQELEDCRRVHWTVSEASIAMLRVQGLTADTVLERLERAGILASAIGGEGVAGQHYIRVNQGTPAENRRFVEVVKGLFG
jgi:histidinol-phosphate aminotransferase